MTTAAAVPVAVAPTATPTPAPEKPAPPQAAAPAPEAAKLPPPAAPSFAERVQREREKREVEALRADAAKAKELAKQLEAERAWRAGLKTNPGAALKGEFGDGWKDLMAEVMVDPNRVTPDQVRATVESAVHEVQAKIDADRKAADEAARAQEAETRKEWLASITDYVKATPDYKLINAAGAHDQVATWIEHNYRTTGKLATDAEGAQAVEAGLRKWMLDNWDQAMQDEWLKSRQPATQSPAQGATREVPKLGALHSGLTGSTPDGRKPMRPLAERIKSALEKSQQAGLGSR